MRYVLIVCAPVALAGVANGNALETIIFGTPAMFALLELYPPNGGKKDG